MLQMLPNMIEDTSGATEMMMQEKPGQGVDLGDEVRRAARHVLDVVNQG